VLKHAGVKQIDLVDIDPAVTTLFREHPLFSQINHASLRDSRVHIHNTDAMQFLQNCQQFYDVIIIDLPDPSEPALSKLFSRGFYHLVESHLSKGGVIATQATSPFRSRAAFWCIVHTLQSVKLNPDEKPLHVAAYHTVVPTFGTWGFVLAMRDQPAIDEIKLTVPTRYLSEKILPGMFAFPEDMSEIETPITTLNEPAVYKLYAKGYHQYLD